MVKVIYWLSFKLLWSLQRVGDSPFIAPQSNQTDKYNPLPLLQYQTREPMATGTNLRATWPQFDEEPIKKSIGGFFSSIGSNVWKWNVRFDGHKDPIYFLERLEEAYKVDRNDMKRELPKLFTSTALLWYRNGTILMISYDSCRRSFELQFLPPRAKMNLWFGSGNPEDKKGNSFSPTKATCTATWNPNIKLKCGGKTSFR